jgi:hypothetical protein
MDIKNSKNNLVVRETRADDTGIIVEINREALNNINRGTSRVERLNNAIDYFLFNSKPDSNQDR